MRAEQPSPKLLVAGILGMAMRGCSGSAIGGAGTGGAAASGGAAATTGGAVEIDLAWLNWWLKGDETAAGKGLLVGSSCTYCTNSAWQVKSKNLP